MQLFYDFSEEDGGCEGLGVISGSVKKIDNFIIIRVPNIGWRKITSFSDTNLLNGIKIDPTFYFVHSYACHTTDASIVKGKLKYGKIFDVLIEKQNIFWHSIPSREKSAGWSANIKNFFKHFKN